MTAAINRTGGDLVSIDPDLDRLSRRLRLPFHSTSGALKNALDYLYREWNHKAVGFVSYGGTGGTRAVEHLRLIAAELKLADVRGQVALMLGSDFEEYRTFVPNERARRSLDAMLSGVLAWSTALAGLRTTQES